MKLEPNNDEVNKDLRSVTEVLRKEVKYFRKSNLYYLERNQ